MKNKIPETATIIPSDFIIIGGTGHLSMSKIIPALLWRFIDKQIDQKSNIILCDREIKSKENFEKLQKPFQQKLLKETRKTRNIGRIFKNNYNYKTRCNYGRRTSGIIRKTKRKV